MGGAPDKASAHLQFSVEDLWESRLGDLRRTKRNSGVYDEIVDGLREAGFSRTRAQVNSKIENLSSEFRVWQKGLTTGSDPVPWIFFKRLHKFLATLPINNPSLVRQSPITTVPQIIYGMESGGTDTDTDDGNCAQLTTPPADNQETDVDAFEYGDLDPP
ncbi:uncharacterized protein LOC144168287 [Haemaphysalis longicornis]